MIAIIDYDAGNLKSVEKALIYLGEQVIVTRDSDKIFAADKVILPGVGAFGDAMDKLHKYNLVHILKKVAHSGTPFLGICLGMQLLFESSEEAPSVSGLSLLAGKIIRFPAKSLNENNEKLKIPHMGWNSLQIAKEKRLFYGLDYQPYVYFVHSYYLQTEQEEAVAAKACYGVSFDAAVEQNNIYGCQFHPEKSGKVGLKILENFSKLS